MRTLLQQLFHDVVQVKQDAVPVQVFLRMMRLGQSTRARLDGDERRNASATFRHLCGKLRV
jgi:hypothetical protein